jgi:hypothetical protein
MSSAHTSPIASPDGARALRQACGLGVLAVALGAAALGLQGRADDMDETRIVVGQWRSLGAEKDLLFARADRLPARFLRAHARQLSEVAAEAHEDLAGLQPAPEVEVDLAPVAGCAQDVSAALQALRRGVLEERGRGCASRLAGIEQALER